MDPAFLSANEMIHCGRKRKPIAKPLDEVIELERLDKENRGIQRVRVGTSVGVRFWQDLQ